MKTYPSSKITWVIYPANGFSEWVETFCADGDGLVIVARLKLGFYIVLNQGMYIQSFQHLNDALECAQDVLEEDFPEVFEQNQHAA